MRPGRSRGRENAVIASGGWEGGLLFSHVWRGRLDAAAAKTAAWRLLH
jgi:hypothetical protein